MNSTFELSVETVSDVVNYFFVKFNKCKICGTAVTKPRTLCLRPECSVNDFQQKKEESKKKPPKTEEFYKSQRPKKFRKEEQYFGQSGAFWFDEK